MQYKNNWWVLIISILFFFCLPVIGLAIFFGPQFWEKSQEGKSSTPTPTSALVTYVVPTATAYVPPRLATPTATPAFTQSVFQSWITPTPIPTQQLAGTYCQLDGNSRLACRPYGASIIGVVILADGFERINASNTGVWTQNTGIPSFPPNNPDAMWSWTAPDLGSTRCWLWHLTEPIPGSVGVMVYSSLGTESFLAPTPHEFEWVMTPPQVSVCSLDVSGSTVVPQNGDTLTAYIAGLDWEVTQDRINEFAFLNNSQTWLIAGQTYAIPQIWVNPNRINPYFTPVP